MKVFVGCCLVQHKVIIYWEKFAKCQIHIGQDLVESDVGITF